MFKTDYFSPLDLSLDEKNPRFLIEGTPTQEEIRKYMIENENVLRLAQKMTDMDNLLPGERIIICEENDKNIVLEGNRRTCIYQMCLNRKLIPDKYVSSFPNAKTNLLDEILKIPVDIVSSRAEAMPYLAARHIEGVEKWSSISQWRISYSSYEQGKTIGDICDYLVLTPNKVKTNIQNYKILSRALSYTSWANDEKKRLNLIDIKPDRLIRIIRSGMKTLGLYFDNNFDLKSNSMPDTKLDEIIKILTYKALIETDPQKQIDTRTNFSSVMPDISHLIPKMPASPSLPPLPPRPGDSGYTADQGSSVSVRPSDAPAPKTGTDSSLAFDTGNGTESGFPANTRGIPKPKQPYFFEGLDTTHLSRDDVNAHGLLRIAKEIYDFSSQHLVSKYTMSSAFLTRALIEQSLIYYSKKHCVQGSSKIIWDQICQENKDSKLSKIVDQYVRMKLNYISDKKIYGYFEKLFSDCNETINPLNWVVHRSDEYMISPDNLTTLPSGLLTVINYLLA